MSDHPPKRGHPATVAVSPSGRVSIHRSKQAVTQHAEHLRLTATSPPHWHEDKRARRLRTQAHHFVGWLVGASWAS